MKETWLCNDVKTLGTIAQGVELQHETKIRSASTAMHAWSILREFYNRATLHNRVEMTRRLYEFKMESGSTMSKHRMHLTNLLSYFSHLESLLMDRDSLWYC